MHLPGPLRAAVGLIATAADEAKHLPDRAIELPMLVVSTALQASLRAQQRYARLTARGDEVLTRRQVSDAAPEWATFDEPLSVDELRRAMLADAIDGTDGFGDADSVSMAESMVGSMFGVSDPSAAAEDAGPTQDEAGADAAFETARREEAERRTAAAKKTSSARKAVARKAASAAKKAATNKAAAAKKAAAGKADESETAETVETTAKTVHKPRHTTPSAFDDVADD